MHDNSGLRGEVDRKEVFWMLIMMRWLVTAWFGGYISDSSVSSLHIFITGYLFKTLVLTGGPID